MIDILHTRRAGLLLHITSLPGAEQNGCLGKEAHRFIDFLHDLGITVWQTLPLNAPHEDNSPYQSLSAHAGNPALIDLDWLVDKGWLNKNERCQDCGGSPQFTRCCRLTKAYHGFKITGKPQDQRHFDVFCQQQAFWLEDYALFMALKHEFSNKPWNLWPAPYRLRDPETLSAARSRLKIEQETIKFEQFVFFSQWQELRNHASHKGVLLFGDIPIFVSYDSADVWMHPEVFKLNEQGEMMVVAGVPPDYFSATGQRWGNPHYNWEHLENNHFQWWQERMRTQIELFDIVRIDHFRGLEAAWEIPANESTAINGQWVEAPGQNLLTTLFEALGPIPLVAEDLGVITPEVEALRDQFGLPGMKILQFAFSGEASNPYLPGNFDHNCVVYTGTHDNNTTLGWYQSLTEAERAFVHDYLGEQCTNTMPFILVRLALASVANLAIIPMQDLLELDAEHRMNTPGTSYGNWHWRFDWEQVKPEQCQRLKHAIELFRRNPL
ncbi:MAG: 4-alpha-glucanotransferase [Methylococcales bacterium]|nr:4-alpha-glucanotransferase [Methylococcales bacterium]